MSVSKEELLHIARLADLKIRDDEVDQYLKNLDDILKYVEIINNAPVEDMEETVGVNNIQNAFRKDDPQIFDNIEGILQNAHETERNMYKIPKVIE